MLFYMSEMKFILWVGFLWFLHGCYINTVMDENKQFLKNLVSGFC